MNAKPPRNPPFSDDAATLIHQTSRGYPRAVNNLALQVLVAAFGSAKAIVDESSARAAVAEVTQNDHHPGVALTSTAPPRRPGLVRHHADGAWSRPPCLHL